MKLVHKNFLYTAILTGALTVMVLGYFIFMLPSLYVEYMSEENYQAILAQHQTYLEDGNYENVEIKNTNAITIDLPLSSEDIKITGKMFQITATPKTESMKNLVMDVKAFIKKNVKSMQKQDLKEVQKKNLQKEFDQKLKQWKEILLKESKLTDSIPFSFDAKTDLSYYQEGWTEKSKFHYISTDTIILENSVSDGENEYTNYLGITFYEDRLIVSMLSTMTPQMNEIVPIIMGSLPMLIAVLVLFALVVSYLYSKGIVDPITKLVKQTQAIKNGEKLGTISAFANGKDEISMLIATLNELYVELEQKNKRQEVFLRASSHQLKTPISAALLLVDGMINQIGKYKDTSLYLPQVKNQLFSMKKIVEDILYLSRCEENISKDRFMADAIVTNQMNQYEPLIQEKNIILSLELLESCEVRTDVQLFVKIIDNLLSNAVKYGKPGGAIQIRLTPSELCIINEGNPIDAELLPHIFEPFVSRSEDGQEPGHGLGLYIANYYAHLLNLSLEVDNCNQGVCAKLTIHTIRKTST